MAERGLVVETNEDGSITYGSHKYGATDLREKIANIYDSGEITDEELPQKRLKDLNIEEKDLEAFNNRKEFIDHLSNTSLHYEAIWINGDLYHKIGKKALLAKPDYMKELIKLIGLSNTLFYLEKYGSIDRNLEEIFRIVDPPKFLKSDNLKSEDIYHFIRDNFDTF